MLKKPEQGWKTQLQDITLYVKFFFVPLIVASVFLSAERLGENEPALCHPIKNRMVVVLLDGADWRIIEPLMEAGRLPTFQKLAAGGSRGILYAVDPYSTPNDVSIFTGVLPQKHGITTHFYFDEAARQLKQRSLSKVEARQIWETLGGQYCFSVLSFVETPTAFPVNNVSVGALFNIKEIQGHSGLSLANNLLLESLGLFGALVYPKNFFDNLDTSFLEETGEEMRRRGLYRAFNSPVSKRMADNVVAALKTIGNSETGSDYLIDGIRKVFASENSAKFIYDYDALTKNLAVRLLENEASNVYFVYFMGTDTFGHMYYTDGWRVSDPDNSREQLFKYYEVIDSYIAELMAAAGSNATFLVLSDTGIQDVSFDDYEASIKKFGNPASKYYKTRLYPPHTAEAIFIAHGPDIAQADGIRGTMTDIAPTIHCLLGAAPNANEYDGAALENIFAKKQKLHPDCGEENDRRRETFLEWSKNAPSEFLNLAEKDKAFLHSVASGAIRDFKNGVKPPYLWKRYSFAENIVFVTLEGGGSEAASYWVSRENVAEGVYDAAYAILERAGIEKVVDTTEVNTTIRILYSQNVLDENFSAGEHAVGIVEEDGGYIFYDTSAFKNAPIERIADTLCSKRGLPPECSKIRRLYYWDVITL